MSNYRIQKLERGDFGLLVPLMKDCFGTDVQVSYFEWKFLNNPAGDVVGFTALSDEGEVAAYYGMIPELYVVNGARRVIYQSCDTMTHSKHRRKGLFQKLAVHSFEYLRAQDKLFVIGFGGGESTPGFIKFGWQQYFVVRNYFFPRILTHLSRGRASDTVVEVHDLSTIEAAALKSNRDVPIHTEKTLDVLKWRLSNPRHSYKVEAIGEKDSHRSYLISYVEGEKLIIFDFYFDRPEDGQALIGHLKHGLRHSKLKGAVYFGQEGSLPVRQLQRHGFLSNPLKRGPLSQVTPFIFYSNAATMAEAAAPRLWRVNAFDHDAM